MILSRESGRGAMNGWLGALGFTLRAGGATDDFKAGESLVHSEHSCSPAAPDACLRPRPHFQKTSLFRCELSHRCQGSKP